VYRQLMEWLTGASPTPSEPLTPAEPRRAPRVFEPKVVVYYWDGSVPAAAHQLRDISLTGAYLYTSERWYPGTIVRLLLQERTPPIGGDSIGEPAAGTAPGAASTSVPARVVRHGSDGVAVEFLFRSSEDRQLLAELVASMNGRASPGPVTVAPKDQAPKDQAHRGQALVEFALIVPLLFLLIINTVNFGGFLFAWITIANAARAGADYWVLGSAAITTPTPATAAQVTTLVTNDIASLLGRSSLVVRVCKNNNSVVTCTGTGSLAPPADPEPSTYILTTVDVTVTYQPPIPLWNLAKLGISATLPPTTIHRRAVMRMLQ
jgi:Flp pilus assembly protein TadG